MRVGQVERQKDIEDVFSNHLKDLFGQDWKQKIKFQDSRAGFQTYLIEKSADLRGSQANLSRDHLKTLSEQTSENLYLTKASIQMQRAFYVQETLNYLISHPFHFKNKVERSKEKLSFLARVKSKQESSSTQSFSQASSQETSKIAKVLASLS